MWICEYDGEQIAGFVIGDVLFHSVEESVVFLFFLLFGRLWEIGAMGRKWAG
jgi:hypothetical protein